MLNGRGKHWFVRVKKCDWKGLKNIFQRWKEKKKKCCVIDEEKEKKI